MDMDMDIDTETLLKLGAALVCTVLVTFHAAFVVARGSTIALPVILTIIAGIGMPLLLLQSKPLEYELREVLVFCVLSALVYVLLSRILWELSSRVVPRMVSELGGPAGVALLLTLFCLALLVAVSVTSWIRYSGELPAVDR